MKCRKCLPIPRRRANGLLELLPDFSQVWIWHLERLKIYEEGAPAANPLRGAAAQLMQIAPSMKSALEIATYEL
jgi:hypothetical protein